MIGEDGRDVYESFIRESPVPMWVQGERTVRFANEQAAEFVGVDAVSDLVGRSALAFVPEDERERALDRNRYVLENERPIGTMEGRIDAADGETRHGRFVAFPVRYEDEVALLVIAHDVTLRREYERTLERQTRRLEEFADVLSHDLRNPLEVAYGELALARQECDSDRLDGVETALKRMDDLVDSTLAMARAGQHVESEQFEPVSLAAFARRCWNTVETTGAELAIAGDVTVEADGLRLRQVFENLFRNAIQHTDGPVTITVGSLDDGSGFYVEDDGSGIDESERDRIFESGYTTHATGDGLGLNVVSAIVTAHGWEVAVTEGEGGGARFEITGVDVFE